ncbi:MAG: hypothetical protein HND51_23955 [Chloroflexi bacterium]|nr:hypothetical protein [Chloroflexota bacterium]NOH14703.1 hypothetical protein [Chloroflexota bacterium]
MLKLPTMTEQSLPPQARELPEPNPVTRRNHKREVLWQITLPFLAGLLMLIVLATLLTLNEVGTFSNWAEISTILLIIPLLILSLIPLALFATLAYLIMMLIPNIPPYARLVQDAIRKVGHYARRGADMAAEPILRTQSFSARLRTLLGKDRT